MNKELIVDLMKANENAINKFISFYGQLTQDINELNVDILSSNIQKVRECISPKVLIKPTIYEIKSLAEHKDIIDNCEEEQKEIDKVNAEIDALQAEIKKANEEVGKENNSTNNVYTNNLNKYNAIKDSVKILEPYKKYILFLIEIFKIKIDFAKSINDIDTEKIDKKIHLLKSVLSFNIKSIIDVTGPLLFLCALIVLAISPIADLILVLFITLGIILILVSSKIIVDNIDVVNALFINNTIEDLRVSYKEFFTEDSPEFKERTDALVAKFNSITKAENMKCKRLEEIEANLTEVENLIEEEYKKYVDRTNEVLNKLTELENRAKEFREKYISEKKYLIDYFSDNLFMDENIRIGREGIAETSIPIKGKNFIVKGPKADAYINTLIPAFMSAVRPGSCIIHICDPNDMGKSVAEYYDDDYSDLFLFESSGISESLNKAKELMQNVIKDCKGLPIDKFNEVAQQQGSKNIPYNVYFILSQGKEEMKKEELLSLLESSVEQGIIIVWKTDEIPQDINRDKVIILEG